MVTQGDGVDGGMGAYFHALQEKLRASLGVVDVISHPVGRGDEAEVNWLGMLDDHLPKRYQPIGKCYVVDHDGNLSDEIDIALCDRQYSTLVLAAEDRLFVPAEAVYAVFEVKPRASRDHVLYAADKVSSVRELKRTSAPIVHAGGTIEDPREPFPVIGGLLCTGSDWADGLGEAFVNALKDQSERGRLDLGCVLSHGGWRATYGSDVPDFTHSVAEHALVYLYLKLLQCLQQVGTVPAMDFDEWGSFLDER